jgi:hypothetical protein
MVESALLRVVTVSISILFSSGFKYSPLEVRIQRVFGLDLMIFALGSPNPEMIRTGPDGICS